MFASIGVAPYGTPTPDKPAFLQPDDHLVLFTDGAIEALNAAGEEFGMGRITALLGANAQATTPQILARLQEAVLSFSSGVPQHDDITMMVLGFRESR